jgi:hypothetical protein
MLIRRSDHLMARFKQAAQRKPQPRHADEAANLAVDAGVLPQHVPRQWDMEEVGDLPQVPHLASLDWHTVKKKQMRIISMRNSTLNPRNSHRHHRRPSLRSWTDRLSYFNT